MLCVHKRSYCWITNKATRGQCHTTLNIRSIEFNLHETIKKDFLSCFFISFTRLVFALLHTTTLWNATDSYKWTQLHCIFIYLCIFMCAYWIFSYQSIDLLFYLTVCVYLLSSKLIAWLCLSRGNRSRV